VTKTATIHVDALFIPIQKFIIPWGATVWVGTEYGYGVEEIEREI
jgi:hypothetical protein